MHDQPHRVDLDVTLGRGGSPRPRDPETPFHIAILGNFSGGHGSASGSRPTGPVAVDRDDLDDVLARFKPVARVTLDEGQEPLNIAFSELEDFHPDELRRRLPVFRELADRWKRLVHDALFEEEAPAAPEPEGPTVLDLTSGGLLDQIVETADPGGSPSRSRDPLQAFVRRVVAPQRIAARTVQEVQDEADLNEATGTLMRDILHNRAFQELEVAWRGIDFLVRRLETGPRLKVFLVDAGKDALADQLKGSEAAPEGQLQRVLESGSDRTGTPWSLLVGLHTFDATPEDAELLNGLSALAQRCGAPFVAGAAAPVAGFATFGQTPEGEDWTPPLDEDWKALRTSVGGSWVGLAAPRFLLREPYGRDGEVCDLRGFEEAPGHEAYAWGDPALLVALSLGTDFDAAGWEFRPGRTNNVDRLPLYLHKVDGETAAQSCAECVMTERVADRMMDSGVIPIAWLRDRPEVRIVRIQSLADPPKALRGPWNA